jgi:hypothetical protein
LNYRPSEGKEGYRENWGHGREQCGDRDLLNLFGLDEDGEVGKENNCEMGGNHVGNERQIREENKGSEGKGVSMKEEANDDVEDKADDGDRYTKGTEKVRFLQGY